MIALWRAPQETDLAFLFSRLVASTNFGTVCIEIKRCQVHQVGGHHPQLRASLWTKSVLTVVASINIENFIPQLDQNQCQAAQTGFLQTNTHHHLQMYIQCATNLRQRLAS